MSDHAADDVGNDADMEWNDPTASSADPAQKAQIKMFCSVTGADANSALHVLEAHNWDMDRSVMFFLEGGASAPRQSRLANTATSAGVQAAQKPIDLDNDDHDDGVQAPAAQQLPEQAVGAAPPSDHEVVLESLCCFMLGVAIAILITASLMLVCIWCSFGKWMRMNRTYRELCRHPCSPQVQSAAFCFPLHKAALSSWPNAVCFQCSS